MCIPEMWRKTPPVPDNTALKPNVLKWAVTVDGKEINYGQVHDMIHRDIAIGNDYRKERIKLLCTLATGVFALTVTFHKDLFAAKITVPELLLLLAGWGLLLISLLAGIKHFRKWEDFYLEHRASGNAVWKYQSGGAAEQAAATIEFNAAQSKIKSIRESYRIWNNIQSWALILGLACIAIYVGLSAWSIAKSTPGTSTVLAPIGGAATTPKAPAEK
jgi:hypothetical protein